MCQPGYNIPNQNTKCLLKKKKILRSVFAQFNGHFNQLQLHKMDTEAKWQKETRPMSPDDLKVIMIFNMIFMNE